MKNQSFKDLVSYRSFLMEKFSLASTEIPKFDEQSRLDASILLVLHSPERTDCQTKGKVSINNLDYVSKNIKGQISRVGVSVNKVLIWNFFGAYGLANSPKSIEMEWGTSLALLINQMPNIRVVVGCGLSVWKSLFNLELTNMPYLIGIPEPTKRNLSSADNKKKFEDRWDRISKCLVSGNHDQPKGVLADAKGIVKEPISGIDGNRLKSLAEKVEGKVKKTIADVDPEEISLQIRKVRNEIKNVWLDAWGINKNKDSN